MRIKELGVVRRGAEGVRSGGGAYGGTYGGTYGGAYAPPEKGKSLKKRGAVWLHLTA